MVTAVMTVRTGSDALDKTDGWQLRICIDIMEAATSRTMGHTHARSFVAIACYLAKSIGFADSGIAHVVVYYLEK